MQPSSLCKCCNKTSDINLPSINCGYNSQAGRGPDCYQQNRTLTNQQKNHQNFIEKKIQEGKRLLLHEGVTTNFDKLAEKKELNHAVIERANQKMADYEAFCETRRKKLFNLYTKEERQHNLEVTNQAEKANICTLEEMRQLKEVIKAKREEEHNELVKQKRMQQYKENFPDIRPLVFKRNLIISKNSQLEQIRDKEIKKKMEKELDDLWHQNSLQELEKKKIREENELLKESQTHQELKASWDNHIKNAELKKVEQQRAVLEDRLELKKIQEQMRQEKIKEKSAKIESAKVRQKELHKQIEEVEGTIAEKRAEELALDKARTELSKKELEEERSKISETSRKLKRESLFYRRHLHETNEQKKLEEQQLEELLKEDQNRLFDKQTEKQSKLEFAKNEFKQEVLKARAQQLELKQQQLEEDKKLRQKSYETQKRLMEQREKEELEKKKREKELQQEHHSALTQQIEYKRLLKCREKELEAQHHAECLAEEAKLREITKHLASNIETEEKHPFLQFLLETPTCPPH